MEWVQTPEYVTILACGNARVAPEGLRQHFSECERVVFDEVSTPGQHAEQRAACVHFEPLELWGRLGLIAPANKRNGCGMITCKYGRSRDCPRLIPVCHFDTSLHRGSFDSLRMRFDAQNMLPNIEFRKAF
eukprot:1159204-Pelagomonas_calceolata.AAC.4